MGTARSRWPLMSAGVRRFMRCSTHTQRCVPARSVHPRGWNCVSVVLRRRLQCEHVVRASVSERRCTDTQPDTHRFDHTRCILSADKTEELESCASPQWLACTHEHVPPVLQLRAGVYPIRV